MIRPLIDTWVGSVHMHNFIYKANFFLKWCVIYLSKWSFQLPFRWVKYDWSIDINLAWFGAINIYPRHCVGNKTGFIINIRCNGYYQLDLLLQYQVNILFMERALRETHPMSLWLIQMKTTKFVIVYRAIWTKWLKIWIISLN